MRSFIVVAAVAAAIVACSGSTSTTSDDGGGVVDGSSSSSSSSGGSSTGSSSGVNTGSCPQLMGTYQITWTVTSGGSPCMPYLPANGTTTIAQGMSIPGPPADAGLTCSMSVVGCNYTASCNEPLGDAGSVMFTQNYAVATDGNISGTETINGSFSFGGQTTSLACVFSMTGTKM